MHRAGGWVLVEGLRGCSKGALSKTSRTFSAAFSPSHRPHLQEGRSSYLLAAHAVKRVESLLTSGTAEGRHEDRTRTRGQPPDRATRGAEPVAARLLRRPEVCESDGGGLSGCGARFRLVRRRRPAAKGASAGPPAAALRAPPARRPSVSARLNAGRDDMSNKEGGVLSSTGRYLFQGGGSPVFLSDFPFLPEGCLRPLQAGGGGPGDFPGHTRPIEHLSFS